MRAPCQRLVWRQPAALPAPRPRPHRQLRTRATRKAASSTRPGTHVGTPREGSSSTPGYPSHLQGNCRLSYPLARPRTPLKTHWNGASGRNRPPTQPYAILCQGYASRLGRAQNPGNPFRKPLAVCHHRTRGLTPPPSGRPAGCQTQQTPMLPKRNEEVNVALRPTYPAGWRLLGLAVAISGTTHPVRVEPERLRCGMRRLARCLAPLTTSRSVPSRVSIFQLTCHDFPHPYIWISWGEISLRF